jgi:hypothetical protein
MLFTRKMTVLAAVASLALAGSLASADSAIAGKLSSGGGGHQYGGGSTYHPSGGSTPHTTVTQTPRASGGFTSGGPSHATVASAPTPPRASPGFTSGGTTANHATAATPAGAPAPRAAALPTSARDQMVNRQVSAQAYNGSARGQVSQNRATVMAATGGRSYTPQQINSTRTVYVHTYYHDRYIPSYAYSGSYGLWSNLFLYAMISNPNFGYNHWNDPSYQDWYRQAQLQAQTDATLRAQLEQQQKQIAQMQASGAARDPNYVPPNTPAQVMYADSALTGAQPAAAVTPVPVNHGHPVLTFLAGLIMLGIIAAGIKLVFFPAQRRGFA